MSTDERYRRLLIIDDNEAIHADYDKILGKDAEPDPLEQLSLEFLGQDETDKGLREFELVHALQGKEGLERLQEAVAAGQTFGAAFVDMRMPPGWDGVETIEHLWEVDPHLQVVICTAYSSRNWEDITGRLGQTDRLLILKKPFDEVEVVQLATSLTEKRRLLDLSQAELENLECVVDEQAAELKEAHSCAQTLLNSIPSALISLDERGFTSTWNPVAERLFGIDKVEATGKRLTGLGIQWTNLESLAELIASKNSHHEIQFVDRSGKTKTLDANACPIEEDPSAKSRVLVLNDVTQQKLLQSQLAQAQKLESVGQLAAGVAHEINTPMQYIGDNVRFVSKALGNLDDLLKTLPLVADAAVSDEDVIHARNEISIGFPVRKVRNWIKQIPEALQDSIEGVEAVAKIVNAMKEFSHPGVQERCGVQLNRVLESTITVARNEWKYVADVTTNFDEDLPEVQAFPSELNQAFLNIVVNAAHAIGERVENGDFEKGTIEVSTRRCLEFAVVEIKDNGGGIPSELQTRVFEPFFTTKEVGKGTGQGLSIVHSVVVGKHGGAISLNVDEGEGSSFVIQLPYEQGESSTAICEDQIEVEV